MTSCAVCSGQCMTPHDVDYNPTPTDPCNCGHIYHAHTDGGACTNIMDDCGCKYFEPDFREKL